MKKRYKILSVISLIMIILIVGLTPVVHKLPLCDVGFAILINGNCISNTDIPSIIIALLEERTQYKNSLFYNYLFPVELITDPKDCPFEGSSNGTWLCIGNVNEDNSSYPLTKEICEEMGGFFKITNIRPPTTGIQLDYGLYGLACIIPINDVCTSGVDPVLMEGLIDCNTIK